MSQDGPLLLTIQDAEDLEIFSAALQDSVLRVGDMTYDKKRRRFAAVVNRFRWEKPARFGRSHSRVRTGFHFDDVLNVKSKNLLHDRPDGILELLAVTFTSVEEGIGDVDFVFAGGGYVRLRVECLSASLADITEAWATEKKPHHKGLEESSDD